MNTAADTVKKEKLISYTPYVRTRDDVRTVMLDVIVSLIPAIAASFFVYGAAPLLVVAVCVLSAVMTELVFSFIFFGNPASVRNLSAVITGILLALTLAPFTPLHVAAFGSAMAVIFGKLIFGGLGRNPLNPAVLGREFMTVFFSSAMSSGIIWFNSDLLKNTDFRSFSLILENSFTKYLDGMILASSGAIGEYSVFALTLGGLYLLYRNRISFHIPVALFTTIFIGIILSNGEISIPLGGLLLCGIFMATDMPTSPAVSAGKLYYGAMMGAVIIFLSKMGIQSERLSYTIIVLNIFASPINSIFRPVIFGYRPEIMKKAAAAAVLTAIIFAAAYVLTLIHYAHMVPYLLLIYITATTVNLIRSKEIR